MTLRSPHPTRRGLLCGCAALAAVSLAGCGRKDATDDAGKPREIAAQSSCSLDGMLLSDYPGPKAQIHYDGQPAPEFFCDTVEMLSMLLKPEQARKVKAVYVQDMGKADWAAPRGAWIDARSAFYVQGSSKRGAMGPTLISFATEADATKFAAEFGGKVLPFAQITPDMVRLDGGALHDQRM